MRVNSTLLLGGIMRFRKDVLLLALVLCTGVVLGSSSDASIFWVYGSDEAPYSGIELVDTSSLGPPFDSAIGIPPQLEIREDNYDTTASIMHYFSFKYQFKKGWSGFKLMWEERDWTWDATPYDSLVIKYIGPLQSHKVDIWFGETYDRYAAAFLDSIGTLPSNYAATYSSSAWKTVTIPFPHASDSADRTQVREIRFIIHNAAGTTSLTSDTGNFSFDKVGFKKANNSGIKASLNRQSLKNNRMFFTPATGGTANLSIFSVNGILLADKKVSVLAGKSYSIRQFTSAHANVSASQVTIVRINGAGINVHEMMR